MYKDKNFRAFEKIKLFAEDIKKFVEKLNNNWYNG